MKPTTTLPAVDNPNQPPTVSAPRPLSKAKALQASTAKSQASPTPAMRQYLEQKAKVGDAILLFRMGDFYETFYDDAKTISRVLGLTLTARDKNSAEPVPLAGVPYHALDRYVAKLVRAGFKVAISEQVEDPALAKTVVKRELVRIITPGTLTDEALLDERSDNYLAALCPAGKSLAEGQVGLACVELASGRFFAQMLPAGQVADELARLRPAELLVPESDFQTTDPILEQVSAALQVPISRRPAHVFDAHFAETRLCEHFQIASVAGYGFDGFDASLSAASAILDYLKETQKAALDHILKIVPRDLHQHVMIDQVTLRSLEVERTLRDGAREGSLLGAIDLTVNPMGARRLRDWLCYPLRDLQQIRDRQQAIADLCERPDKLQLIRDLVKEIGDAQRIIARLGIGRATPRDMESLGWALRLCGDLCGVLGQPSAPSGATYLLSTAAVALQGHGDLAGYLLGALKEGAPASGRDGGFIADGFDAELDRLRHIGREGAAWLAEYQAREAGRTGIQTLKIDYNSVFGYYIEITHQHRDKVPPDYVRKQTVRNAERYITDDLKRYEDEALGAEEKARHLESELFDAIRARAAADLPRLQAAGDALATLDVLSGLAELSRRRDYCRPEFVETPKSRKVEKPKQGAGASSSSKPVPEFAEGQASGLLEIVDGRHPVLDVLLAQRFVPNDCVLGADDQRLLIITGPNMAGKSTYIRQVALLVLLAQTGSYVPAKAMRLSPVDRIFARVGASDELARGHSTFMVEMVETARILNNATPDCLIVLDEIGRGTSTYDGLAIAWAITEHLIQQVGCRSLFATHYHELTELGDQLPGAANFNVAVREELRAAGAGRDVVFLHKIVPGPADRSYGVHVAAMAGLPPSVVKRSEAVLERLESSFETKSRRRGLEPAGAGQPDQLMLFQAAPALPDWWQPVFATLKNTDITRTTPMEALAAIERLKAMIPDET